MVYNDHEVQGHFKIRAFVYVSTGFDAKGILLKILSSFAKTDEKGLRRWMKNVYKYISSNSWKENSWKENSVLEDVRGNDAWNRLKNAFPDEGNKRCRVLITTRDKGLAEQASRGDPEYVFKMPFLSLESSRELLRWLAFGDNCYPVELQEYEEIIVIKCIGLPLALQSVVAMIMKHPDMVEWWKATTANSFVEQLSDSSHVLYLAYMHLPNHLKPCFLYLAIFGPETEIPIGKLLRLWISKGFILEDEADSRSLEDIAEQYLEHLVDRHFVMVSKRRSNGRIGICKMNPTLYGYSKFQTSVERILPNDCRYEDILDTLSDCSSEGNNGTRSFLRFPRSEIEVDQKTVSCILKRFKLV